MYSYLKDKHSYLVDIRISHEDEKHKAYEKANNQCFHEAGYDSYVTGCAFIYMYEHIYEFSKNSFDQYENKFFMMFCLFPAFDLMGEEKTIIPNSNIIGIKLIEGNKELSLGSIDIDGILIQDNLKHLIAKKYYDNTNNCLILFVYNDDLYLKTFLL